MTIIIRHIYDGTFLKLFDCGINPRKISRIYSPHGNTEFTFSSHMINVFRKQIWLLPRVSGLNMKRMGNECICSNTSCPLFCDKQNYVDSIFSIYFSFCKKNILLLLRSRGNFYFSEILFSNVLDSRYLFLIYHILYFKLRRHTFLDSNKNS